MTALTDEIRAFLVDSLISGKINLWRFSDMTANKTTDTATDEEIKRLCAFTVSRSDCRLCQTLHRCKKQDSTPTATEIARIARKTQYIRHNSRTKRTFVKWLVTGGFEESEYNEVAKYLDSLALSKRRLKGLSELEYITRQIIELDSGFNTCEACIKMGFCELERINS